MLFGLRGGAPQKILCQNRNIFFSFTQWRQRNRDHVKTIVKILAKMSLSHYARQIPVCRRNHSDVDANLLGAADALKLPLLEKT